MSGEMIVVFTTVSNQADGEALATKIIEAKLAACVQILPPMGAVYVWKGEVTREREHLLLIKTFETKFDELSKFITDNHSYEVPEIVAIDAAKVSPAYLSWMNEVMAE